MGNWRRAQIVGTCDAGEVAALRAHLDFGGNLERFGPLCSGGICGLQMWPAERISALGNLAERGYSDEAIAEHLTELAALAPSLRVKVHVGGDYETDECVATITLDEHGARVGLPEIKELPKIGEGQMAMGLLAQLMRRR